jgi:hypothetical protein
MTRERIGAEELADHLGQTIEAFAQVGVLGAEKDAHGQRKA